MFQTGNIMAFDLLFDKYRIPVFNFIFRMLEGDRTAAEDLLQNIFIKIAGAKDYYEPRSKFSTWLFMITRNHCLNFLKSRNSVQKRNTVSLDARAEDYGPSLADSLPAAEEAHKTVEQNETVRILEKNIYALPDKYRELFLLHAVEGMSHEEIATILKMSAPTVRTNYRRARLLLLEKIRPFLNNEVPRGKPRGIVAEPNGTPP